MRREISAQTASRDEGSLKSEEAKNEMGIVIFIAGFVTGAGTLLVIACVCVCGEDGE